MRNLTRGGGEDTFRPDTAGRITLGAQSLNERIWGEKNYEENLQRKRLNSFLDKKMSRKVLDWRDISSGNQRNINEAGEDWMRLELTDIKIYWDVQSSVLSPQSSCLAIELYNCLDQEINDSDRESQRRLVVTGLHHNISWEGKKTNLRKSGDKDRKPFNGMFWLLLFWLDCSVWERERPNK